MRKSLKEKNGCDEGEEKNGTKVQCNKVKVYSEGKITVY